MLTQWVKKKMAMVAGMDAKPGLNTTGYSLNKVNDMVPSRNQRATCGKLITMDPFHNTGVDDLSLLEKTLILDLDLCLLPARPLLAPCRKLHTLLHGTSFNSASTRGLPSERSVVTGECPQVSGPLSLLHYPEAETHTKLGNGVMTANLWRQPGDMS